MFEYENFSIPQSGRLARYFLIEKANSHPEEVGSIHVSSAFSLENLCFMTIVLKL